MKHLQKPVEKIVRPLLVALGVMATIAAALAALSILFVPKNNQAEFGMMHQEANGVLGEPANSIDVLFVGDSEVYSSFSPLQMFRERGFASYACSTPSQQLTYSNTLLMRATQNQRPKVVVIETNSAYAPFNVEDAALRAAQDAIPALEYHDRWKTLVKADLTSRPTSTWTDDLKGFVVNEGVRAADPTGHMAPTDKVDEIPLLNQLYLRAMIARCREIGATPVMVSTPSTVNWNMARHNGTAKFCEAEGVTYLDLNVDPHKIDIDWSCDSYDAGDHLNLSGARKVSSYLGGLLSQTFGLSDHRGDASYRAWDEAVERYLVRIRET